MVLTEAELGLWPQFGGIANLVSGEKKRDRTINLDFHLIILRLAKLTILYQNPQVQLHHLKQ